MTEAHADKLPSLSWHLLQLMGIVFVAFAQACLFGLSVVLTGFDSSLASCTENEGELTYDEYWLLFATLCAAFVVSDLCNLLLLLCTRWLLWRPDHGQAHNKVLSFPLFGRMHFSWWLLQRLQGTDGGVVHFLVDTPVWIPLLRCRGLGARGQVRIAMSCDCDSWASVRIEDGTYLQTGTRLPLSACDGPGPIWRSTL